MKFAVVLLMSVAAVSAQFGNGQPYNRNTFNRYKPFSTAAPLRYRPVTTTVAPFYASTRAPVPVIPRVDSADYNAQTLKSENESGPDGSFNYFFETSNGIAAQEQGVPRNLGGNPPVVPVVAQGSFSWISPEGQPISISYTADENGYQPIGDAIPTSPPVPPQIARALAYIARTLPQN